MKKENSKISLDEFIETHPEYKHLYEYIKSRCFFEHTVNVWKNIAKKAEERLLGAVNEE